MGTAVLEKKTVQDYLQLPEESSYQLLNGELIMPPAPSREHQKTSGIIFRLIANLCFEKKLGEVYYSPFDVYLDNENVVQPDISFFSNERLPVLSDRGAEAAPDLIIEILSRFNAYYDLRYKLDLYEKFGVKEYFIVDPADDTVIAYKLTNGKYVEQYREKRVIRSTLLQTDIIW